MKNLKHLVVHDVAMCHLSLSYIKLGTTTCCQCRKRFYMQRSNKEIYVSFKEIFWNSEKRHKSNIYVSDSWFPTCMSRTGIGTCFQLIRQNFRTFEIGCVLEFWIRPVIWWKSVCECVVPTVNLPGYDSHRAFHTKHMTFLAPDPNESFILKTIAQSQSMASSESVDSTLTISSAIKAGVWISNAIACCRGVIAN